MYGFGTHRDVAQSGSAVVWGATGRRFEPGHPDHFEVSNGEPHDPVASPTYHLSSGRRRVGLIRVTLCLVA